MEISCPSCQNRFEAVTRRAVCTFCGTQLDVWAHVSGHSDPPPPPNPPPVIRGKSTHQERDPYSTNLLAESPENVLDLPLTEITPGHSAEEDPVLEPAFSDLPQEFAQIASPVSTAGESPPNGDASPYSTSVDKAQTHSSVAGIAKWLIALAALAAVLVLVTYFLKKTPSSEFAAATSPTIAPEPGPTSSVDVSPTPATLASPLLSPSPGSDAKSRISPTPAPAVATPPVRAAENEEAQTRAREVNPQSTNAKYTLQITAKPSEEEARQVAQKMIEAGLDAKIIRATVGEGKTWYRVRVGGFPTRKEATQYGEQLKRSGRIEGYFVTDLR